MDLDLEPRTNDGFRGQEWILTLKRQWFYHGSPHPLGDCQKDIPILTGAFPRQIAALCPAVFSASNWDDWGIGDWSEPWKWQAGLPVICREYPKCQRLCTTFQCRGLGSVIQLVMNSTLAARWGAEWLGIQVWWDLHYSTPRNCQPSTFGCRRGHGEATCTDLKLKIWTLHWPPFPGWLFGIVCIFHCILG